MLLLCFIASHCDRHKKLTCTRFLSFHTEYERVVNTFRIIYRTKPSLSTKIIRFSYVIFNSFSSPTLHTNWRKYLNLFRSNIASVITRESGRHGTFTLNTQTRCSLSDRLFAELFYGPGFTLAYFQPSSLHNCGILHKIPASQTIELVKLPSLSLIWSFNLNSFSP